MAICQLVINKYGNGAVLVLKSLPHRPRLCFWDFQSWPPIPLKTCRLGESAQAGDQATRRHGKCVLAIVRTLDGDRQSIRDKKQAAAMRRGLIVNDSGHRE